MHLLEEVFCDLGVVIAAFTPIVRAPNDDDVKRLTEAFINAIQSIDIPGGAIDLSDLLLLDV